MTLKLFPSFVCRMVQPTVCLFCSKFQIIFRPNSIFKAIWPLTKKYAKQLARHYISSTLVNWKFVIEIVHKGNVCRHTKKPFSRQSLPSLHLEKKPKSIMLLSLSELLDCLENNTSLAWDSICSYTFTAALHEKPLCCQLASADWLRDIFPRVELYQILHYKTSIFSQIRKTI